MMVYQILDLDLKMLLNQVTALENEKSCIEYRNSGIEKFNLYK